MSSRVWCTSCIACSINASTSEPGSVAFSSSASRRASGVRSSCETAAVKPMRSSWYAESSGAEPRKRTSRSGCAAAASSLSREPASDAGQQGASARAGRDHEPLAVEDDERLVGRFGHAAQTIFVHHSFTIRLPFPNRHRLDNEDSMPKVLIVEDDEVIAEGMSRHLGAAGFDPVSVGNGTQGLARLRYEKPDVCVLDLMLPGIDGWKLIETARNEGIGTPIVVVSARGTEHDRVHALEIGADDYLVKPFSMKELVARVRAASRRSIRREETPRGEPIEIEELRIDPREVQAFVDGVSAELTPTEFRLLYQLALDRGRVVTRDELLQKLWGRRESHRDRTVDVFVRRLREKVDRRSSRHTFIQTRYGVGYRLEPVSKDREDAVQLGVVSGRRGSDTSRVTISQPREGPRSAPSLA